MCYCGVCWKLWLDLQLWLIAVDCLHILWKEWWLYSCNMYIWLLLYIRAGPRSGVIWCLLVSHDQQFKYWLCRFLHYHKIKIIHQKRHPIPKKIRNSLHFWVSYVSQWRHLFGVFWNHPRKIRLSVIIWKTSLNI